MTTSFLIRVSALEAHRLIRRWAAVGRSSLSTLTKSIAVTTSGKLSSQPPVDQRIVLTRVQSYVVPSLQMLKRIPASFRASATVAIRFPRRFSISSAQH